jgi:hypothetical protein
MGVLTVNFCTRTAGGPLCTHFHLNDCGWRLTIANSKGSEDLAKGHTELENRDGDQSTASSFIYAYWELT